MLSLSKLITNKYPFRNYTKELRNVVDEFRVDTRVRESPTHVVENASAGNAEIVMNMNVNYISNNQGQSVSQSFHNTPGNALAKYSPTNTTIPEIFQELVAKHSIYMGFVNEDDKTIAIYNPSMEEDINIVILLEKDKKYAIFEYRHSSFTKIKKTWGSEYRRIDFIGVEKPKTTKKNLLDLAKELGLTEVKTSMKKGQIYDVLYNNCFGFH
jgi:hypothetical protein